MMTAHELKEGRPSWTKAETCQTVTARQSKVQGRGWLMGAMAAASLFAAAGSGYAATATTPPMITSLTLPDGIAVTETPTVAGSAAGYWVADHSFGLCKIWWAGAAPSVVPAIVTTNCYGGGSNLNGPAAPGQIAFDPGDPTIPRRAMLYVTDISAKGRGVYRFQFNPSPTGGTLLNLGPIGGTSGNRAQGVALGPDGNLYVTYGKVNTIHRISNPSGGTPGVPVKIGTTRNKIGPPAIAFVGNALYLAEAIGMSAIADVTSCSSVSPCVPTDTAIDAAPTFVTSNGVDTLYVSNLTSVWRVNFAGCAAGTFAQDLYANTGFSFITSLGIDTAGNLFVGDDPSRGLTVNQASLWMVTAGQSAVTTGACGTGTLPPPPPPVAGGPVNGTLLTTYVAGAQPNANITLPSGLAWVPNPITTGVSNLWIATHAIGLCRLDGAAVNPALCNSASGALLSPGQIAYSHPYLYVPDNASKGTGVWRFKYAANTTGENFVAQVNFNSTGGNRSLAVAQSPANGSLYIVYGKNTSIDRIPNPTSTTCTNSNPCGKQTIGNVTDPRSGPPAMAMVNGNLYFAEKAGVTVMLNADSCASGCRPIPVTTTVLAPTFVAANGDNTALFIGDASKVYKFVPDIQDPTVGTLTVYSAGGVDSVGNAVAYQNVSSLFVDPATGTLYVGDDPTLGATVNQGRVFSVPAQ